jgi:pyruvate/2-oxoglutarate dehydrogenase complex dihydrolipoamide dehydrogenase (E3) component
MGKRGCSEPGPADAPGLPELYSFLLDIEILAMYDLVVVGAGSGGFRVATLAAQIGARVALIEKGQSGAESGHGACLPSKGLVQVSRLIRQIREAARRGIHTGQPVVDLPSVMRDVRSEGQDGSASLSADSLREQGIDLYRGAASFDAYDTILLEDGTRIEGHRFVIATGSRPARPSVPGIDAVGYLDSNSVWSLEKLPESLIVLGADSVGMEFAQVFARFGAQVTVVTNQDRILPNEDPELSGTVACIFAGEGIVCRRQVEVQKVEKRGDRKVCVLRDTVSGAVEELSATEILCTTAREANVEGLNLEAVGVHGDPSHGIEVDDLLQTHAVRIFAIGDVLLRHQFAHAAEREAQVVFQNAVLRRRQRMDYSTFPWATFIDPELASLGITEAAASEQGLEHRVLRVPYDQLDRARIDGRTEGLAKVVVSPSGKILGASILGEEASLVLQQLVVAMDQGLSLVDLAASTQIYPTYGQIITRLVDQFQAFRRGRGLRAATLRFLYGYQPRIGQASAAEAEASEPAASHEPSAHGH